MYYYKFDGDTLLHTLIADAKPNGYVDFGEMIDWTKKQLADGELQDIPTPVIPEPTPYVPTAEQIKAKLINAVQSHLDATAMANGYDGILSAVSYAGDNTVPQFALEGQAYKTWRSQVWAYCYAYLADVQAGTKAVPTASELIALLPVPPAPIEWVVMGNNA